LSGGGECPQGSIFTRTSTSC